MKDRTPPQPPPPSADSQLYVDINEICPALDRGNYSRLERKYDSSNVISLPMGETSVSHRCPYFGPVTKISRVGDRQITFQCSAVDCHIRAHGVNRTVAIDGVKVDPELVKKRLPSS